MQYYAAIDTNVIVSAFLKEDSIPNQVVKKALKGPIVPLLSMEAIGEYEEVLLRNKFKLEKEVVYQFLTQFSKRAIFLEGTKTNEKFIDQDDIIFYEIILSVKNIDDAYLVTGNKKHYPVKHFVVSPRELLDIIESNEDYNL